MTNSLSRVMEPIGFNFPSFSTRLTLTSVTCMFLYPFRLIPHHPQARSPCAFPWSDTSYNVYLSFFSTTILMFSGVPICVVLARIVSLLSTMQFSITVLSPI